MANAGDRRKVQDAARYEKAAKRTEVEQVRLLMSDIRLRAFVKRFLDMTGVDVAPPFNPNAMVMAQQNGVQSVGHWLLAQVREACPELELLMRQEAAALAQRAELQENVDDNEHRD